MNLYHAVFHDAANKTSKINKTYCLYTNSTIMAYGRHTKFIKCFGSLIRCEKWHEERVKCNRPKSLKRKRFFCLHRKLKNMSRHNRKWNILIFFSVICLSIFALHRLGQQNERDWHYCMKSHFENRFLIPFTFFFSFKLSQCDILTKIEPMASSSDFAYSMISFCCWFSFKNYDGLL